MNPCVIVDASVWKNHSDDLILMQSAEFRRATENMLLASIAIKNLSILHLIRPKIATNRLGLVLGTGYGELENAKLFLEFIATENTARPLFFQNSLHNSTTGFVTQLFNIQGPSFSTSSMENSGQACLRIAQQLIDDDSCDAVIALGVDSGTDCLQPLFETLRPSQQSLVKGAAALLLVSQEFSDSLDIFFAAKHDWNSAQKVSSQQLYRGSYDSAYIEAVATAFEEMKSSSRCEIFFTYQTHTGTETHATLKNLENKS